MIWTRPSSTRCSRLLWQHTRKSFRTNDCGEWSREAREWAISEGLFAGNGTTADGQPNYMWASPLTREQAAQLFYRYAQQHGLV